MRGDRFGGIRRVLRIRDASRDVDDELAFHFEQTVVELVDRGLTPQQAREEADRRFGDVSRYRRDLVRADRGLRRRRSVDEWGQDARYIVRRMRRAPGFTAAVVLTFALGIGANLTVFGIIDRLLLRPPEHITDPANVQRLMVERFVSYTGARQTSDVFSYPDYEDFVRAGSFSSVAALSRREVTVGSGAGAQRRDAALASENFFSLLGATPVLGRTWTAEENDPGTAGVVVVSHRMWKREYGGDRSVLGQSIDFGHGPYTIIGVAPRDFTGIGLTHIDLWLPLKKAATDLNGNTRWMTSRGWHSYRVVGRLAPGATTEEAAAEGTVLHRQGRSEQIEGGNYDAEVRILAAPLLAARGPLASNERTVARVAVWLAGVSLIVLLIACANVANLLLARMIRHRREIGIRLALGISRGRLLGQMLAESLALAMLGGVAALLVARWGSDLVRNVLLSNIAWGDAVVGTRVLVVVVGLVLLVGVIAGLVPALQARRPDVLEALRSGARGHSHPGARTRAVLTVMQAALSVVLLVGAGLFVRSLQRVHALDLGLDPEGVLFVDPVFDRELSQSEQIVFFEQALERLSTLPGVAHAAAATSPPFRSLWGTSLRVPGLDSLPTMPGGGPYINAVSPGYFATLELQLRRGRGFTEQDREGAEKVAVVDVTMARTLWPGESALGRCLMIGGSSDDDAGVPCTAVVGVVEDARRYDLVDEKPAMQYYIPIAQLTEDEPVQALLVRVRGVEPETMIPTLQRELLAVGSGLRFPHMQPFHELFASEMRSWRLGATMFSVFGVLALVVAAIGLYSVLAFAVAQRTHELGIRAALGATRERLMAMVLGQGVQLTAVGVALGLMLALLAGGQIAPLLFETSPRDPLTFAAVAAVLLLVAALASGLPAWRATRVDPSEALRAE